MQIRQVKEAIESYKQAIRIDPDYADAHIIRVAMAVRQYKRH
jgi:Tfp pilus assembly protein PilF